nr:MAG TPA: hypothetical protein [Caudoviricetes sp.]
MRDRLLEYIRYRGMVGYQFCKQAGLAVNFLQWGAKGISSKSMHKIGQAFPDLNLQWVATGEGEMLKRDTDTIPLSEHQAIIKRKDEEISSLATQVEQLKSQLAELTRCSVELGENIRDRGGETKVLLSVKPKFVDLIASGAKQFEYRRVLYRRSDIKRIVVYASSPVCRIVGEIEVGDLLTDTPEAIWERTKDKAGVSREFFFSYFDGLPQAHAIEIKAYHPYPSPKKLEDEYPSIAPPQSFCYLWQ